MDTLWKHDDSIAVRAMWLKIDNMTLAQMEDHARKRCVFWLDPRHEQVLNGTDVDRWKPRPQRPERP